jgi:hypothetical protein
VFICTLDAVLRPLSIRGMNSETWLEKATRLQRSLARRDTARLADEDAAARERIELALWLRHEFSEAAPDESNVITFPPLLEP